jgi:adenylate cyclase
MKMFPGGSSDSKDAPQALATAPISAAEVQDQLSRILVSPGFRRSARLQRFLRLAVERTLAGETDQLKEYIVGRDVFDRGADYDPRVDSIVRVEAQRLRRKLREYYQTHGRADSILITLRPGSYAPAFARADHPHSAPVPADAESLAAPARLDPRTVAVLPFSNLSPEPEQDYFCDGITEDIINALTAISELQVIGRTSMFALKPGPLDHHEIGARLGAGTIVEGTVRKAGDLLRVSVKIIESETRQALWSQVFDRETRDVFLIEDEIARSIAGTLRVTLGAGWSHKAPNTEAYVLYLKGRQAWNQMNQERYQAAIQQFSRAISLYPGFALPYAGLADTYTWLAMWGMMRPKEALLKGKHAALEALRLDPSLAQAHSSLSLLRFFFDWEWQEGLALVKEAIDLHPSYSDAHQIHGYFLLVMGRFEEAMPALERAVHLDPLSFRMNRTLGNLCYFQGRATEAEKWLEAAIALKPDSMESHYSLAKLRLQQRRYDAALREALECQRDPQDALALSILGVSLSHNGDRAGALRILNRLSEMSSVAYVDPVTSAFVHAALGNASAALECLGESLEERSPHALLLNVEPLFENLRSDSRFQELVASLKFP